MEYTLLADGQEERISLTDDLRAPAGEPLLGWTPKPHGWCRADACIPASVARGRDDVVSFAELTGKVAVVDTSARVIALADAAGSPVVEAPDFTLDGVSLSDLRGRKVALVFWASWCGCRYDLPAWQERHAALASQGFTVVTVACDRTRSDAEPWMAEAGSEHPALVDVDGLVAEAYNITNVPTVVWIDEDGRVARPQDTQTATDLFRSMNGLSSEDSLAALRRWVVDGDPGVTGPLRTATDDDQRARAHARIAVWLARRGEAEAARGHLDQAAKLSPHDVAIRRGLMPLTGEDPFGDAYFALRTELTDNGIALYQPLP
jgi:peroxiredoxin